MTQLQNSDENEESVQIATMGECTQCMKSLCSVNCLNSECEALIKFLFGFCYLYGIGMDKNEKEGFRWLIESDACMEDKGGYAVAQDRIGFCYDLARGVQKDEAQAVKYYRMVAEKEHAGAQTNLGVCY